MNPENYGTIIDQYNSKYIIQLNTNNVLIIKEIGKDNFVRFYKKGELIFEFKDSKLSDNIFTRTILDQKFTFKDGKLLSTEIMSSVSNTLIYSSEINYKDTEAILTLNTPLNYKNIIKYLENTNTFKTKKAELFILFELIAILLVYIIFFVIFPDEANEINNIATTGFSAHNIIKLRKIKSKNK
jgi:hypothetical protein